MAPLKVAETGCTRRAFLLSKVPLLTRVTKVLLEAVLKEFDRAWILLPHNLYVRTKRLKLS